MSQRGLSALLRPNAIAVIGASETPSRAGFVMLRNLLSSGFSGPILPVTPRYKAVSGVLAYPTVASLPVTPDLAVLCTHPKRNLALLDALGERGCAAVIILASLPSQHAELTACATRYGMRLLGPNSLGVLAPWQNLNASFSPVPVFKGKLAFVSQSSAVANIVLDWAQQREIGFSYFVALGDGVDISVSELLDFLARDSKTSAILLYIENLSQARRFLSASRSASRNKPILMIKSGRSLQAQSLLNYPPSLDAAYDAAIQRAGILRVRNTHELFSAVETLSHMPPLRGERLMIISNGVAPAAMALDPLLALQGKLATINEACCSQLRDHLPDTVIINNPLDLRDDATPEHYQHTLNCLLDSHQCDAILVIHAPSTTAPATQTAECVIHTVKQHPRSKFVAILTNWCGEHSSQQARLLFSEASLPTYRTPEGAITAFMHMVEYRRNQKQLMETPALLSGVHNDLHRARQLIQGVLANQSTDRVITLDTHEVQPILIACGLQTLPTWVANDCAEAVHIAEQIGYPVALKLRSPDISHNSEVQGVILYLNSAVEVQQAATSMLERIAITHPQARIHGLQVQCMADRTDAFELRISVQMDATFGPLILLGAGDTEWLIEKDAAVALPPLNMALARYLVSQALKSEKIRHRTHLTPLDINTLSQLLVQVSNLIVACPEIIEFHLHPLLMSGSTLTLLDVCMKISAYQGDPQARLAIRPYPQELEQSITLKEGSFCLLRPILPEDEPLLKQFISHVTKEDLYYRYFSEITEFTHEDLAKMTQIDYDREMAFVAVRSGLQGSEIIGVTRAYSDPDNSDAEFSILVRSDLKGLGLGHHLLTKLIAYAKQHGLQRLSGITMPDNKGMVTLAKKLGFIVDIQFDEGTVNLTLPLKH